MPTRRFLFSMILAFISTLCVAAQEFKPPVTLLQLIASPQSFDGKRVLVFGYCRLEFEALAIYLNKEDYDYDLGNSVWLDMPMDEITPEKQAIEYCLVDGTFNRANRGHFGMFQGAIEGITRYESSPIWRQPPVRVDLGAGHALSGMKKAEAVVKQLGYKNPCTDRAGKPSKAGKEFKDHFYSCLLDAHSPAFGVVVLLHKKDGRLTVEPRNWKLSRETMLRQAELHHELKEAFAAPSH